MCVYKCRLDLAAGPSEDCSESGAACFSALSSCVEVLFWKVSAASQREREREICLACAIQDPGLRSVCRVNGTKMSCMTCTI